MISPKHLAAVLAVIGFLVFDFIVPAFPMIGMEWGALAVSGVIVGQVNLIATCCW